MRRRHATLSFLLAVATFAVACGEAPSGPGKDVGIVRGPGGEIVAGTCTTVGELNTLAKAVFRTASPDVSSVLGKIKSLDQDVRKGKLASAIAGAHQIVDFTLEHFHAGRLPGTDVELTAFVNSIYCFAGIDIGIDEPTNSHLILPSDQPQVVYSIDAQAAIQFEANPVTEPTLVEFAQIEPDYPPGGGPLDTKLDQYPGFITITKSSETNAPLAKPAVVGICASGVIPQEVRDRLRLGHGKSTGFEIAAPAEAGFLDCENLTDEPETVGVLSRLGRLLSPKPLQARARFARGGGVGGTVTEFSPFAPVDTELRSGGGVGGTVTEFSQWWMRALLTESVGSLVDDCPVLTAPAGDPLPDHCQPFVRITTRLGTPFAQVPVTWTVTAGDGKVTERQGTQCDVYSTAPIVVATDLFGYSKVCWRMNQPGTGRLVATPSVGGDAPAGVSFFPASVTFEAVVTPRPQ
jgi:hypothetical protein